MSLGDRLVAPLAVVAAVFALSACADAGLTDEDLTVVVDIQVTPGVETLDALGATVQLVARAINALGDEVPGKTLTWTSSNAFVASVGVDGMVEAVSNGVADITASVDGVRGGARITVEQMFFQMVFGPGPSDARVAESAGDVAVRAEDARGNALQEADGAVTLRATPGSPGGLSGGPRVAQMAAGVAHFPDVRMDGQGDSYRLEAIWNGRTAVSFPFDVVTAFDAVSLLNADGAGGEIGVLIDGLRGGVALNDFAVTTPSTVAEVGAVKSAGAGGNDEIVAFAPQRRPALLSDVDWTPGVDTIEIALDDQLAVGVVVWIVKGPFTEQAARAQSAIARTGEIWSLENAGVVIDSVEIVDATANPNASKYHALTLCNSKSGLESEIGFTTGRINIYYVGTVDSGTDRGRACPIGGVHVIMAERSGVELLAHEIGHLFSLIHVDGIVEFFDQTNVMHSASSVRRYLTEGQIFRQQFNPSSALNSHFGFRTGESRACPRDDADALCPAIQGRIWPDGAFPPTLVGGVPPALATVDVVARWMAVDCEMNDNEGLSDEVRTMGGAAIAAFAAIASGRSPGETPNATTRDGRDQMGRRVKALDGLALVGGPAARAELVRFAREGPVELRLEAFLRLSEFARR